MDDPDSKLTSPALAGPTAARFSRWQAFALNWQESVRYFGLWRSLRELASATWDAFLELLPSRRKVAFGDLDYDWEHSVDTTRSNVRAGTQFLTGLMARPYFATEPWLFERIMDALGLSIQKSALSIQQSALSQSVAHGAVQDFTFIDLGSGKGRVLLMASEYPFKRIIGVEFMPELHRAAQNNIAKYTTERQQCWQIETFCMDARDFPFPDGPLVVYLFNPFSESTFALILENLRRSVEASPRPVYIAYRFKEFESLLDRSAWLEKMSGAEQWAVYGNRREVGFF